MKIAIIGSGNVGKALATCSVRAGHSLTMSSKRPDKAAEAGAGVGATTAPLTRRRWNELAQTVVGNRR